MLRVIVWSSEDLSRLLASTFLGRTGVDRFKAKSLEEVRKLAQAVGPQLILVDRDLPHVARLIGELRADPVTQSRSLAVLAFGDFQPLEIELLDAGANAILRLPPDAGWDDRLQRLLRVASRQEVRLPIRLAIEAGIGAEVFGDASARSINVSANGMLLETALPLRLGQHLSFTFQIEGGARVTGRGRVVREAGSSQFGIDFVDLDEDGREAVRWLVRSTRIG
jgi:CheY-like chemotaxis protein